MTRSLPDDAGTTADDRSRGVDDDGSADDRAGDVDDGESSDDRSGEVDTATDAGDVDTADLLNELSREGSQYLWFLEAHLQTQPTAQGQGTAGWQPESVRQ